MARRSTDSVEAELFTKLFELMQGLKQTPDGARLYTLIANGYHERAAIQGSVNRAFFEYAITVLKQCVKKPKIDAPTRSRADYILRFIITYIEAYHAELPAWRPVQPATKTADKTHSPFLTGKTFEQHISSMLWAARNELRKSTGTEFIPVSEIPAPAETPKEPVATSSTLHAAYNDLKKQREALAARISTTIGQNLDFVAQLRFMQQILLQEENQDIDQLRELMAEGTDELINSYRELGDNLHQAKSALGAIQSREQQIQFEVNKILQTTLTDEFTGIPNRAAFIRRLEAEIDRAQRHGSPLALALIDPDKIGNIVAGPEASDEVLRIYASHILSRFRAYDMVARYGDKEFAVLLPNAGTEQALSALRNAQQRAATAFYHLNGRKQTPPTFSTGVAWYRPGEAPARLLQRADTALQHARLSGPSWIETALGT